MDFNGNESGFALLEPGGISGVADDGRIPGLAVTVANPMVGRFEVSFSLASERPARLSLFDVAGRLVTSRDVMLFGVGVHSISMDERIDNGVYFLRLQQGDDSRVVRAVVAR